VILRLFLIKGLKSLVRTLTTPSGSKYRETSWVPSGSAGTQPPVTGDYLLKEDAQSPSGLLAGLCQN